MKEEGMSLPTREACEAWSPAQLAYFMHQNRMQECAATVNRLRIDGQRLLNLSSSDMSKFSLIHQPQLQKFVQDIKQNDGGLLNTFRRLKTKQVPKLPARDYHGDGDEDEEQWSEVDESDTDNYEPPPSQRVFKPRTSASFPCDEYIDSCRGRPSHPPRKLLRPVKTTESVPLEPTHVASDEGYYITPEDDTDDNYIEPTEKRPASTSMLGRNGAVKIFPKPVPVDTHDIYEVPDQEEASPPESRVKHTLHTMSETPSPSYPPRASPRMNIQKSPCPVPEPTDEDEYEVCDPDDNSSVKSIEDLVNVSPKPTPRQKPSRPALKPRHDLKHKDSEGTTLDNSPKKHVKALTSDFRLPKIPVSQFNSLGQDKKCLASENISVDTEKETDLYKKPWYAGYCDRKTAEDALILSNNDGSFLVRQSTGQDINQPYTLAVLYNGRVYNIPVRFIPSAQQYALGSKKKGEERFSSVSHIIENHKKNPLVLIDSQSQSRDATNLCYAVKP